mmetsp:Transcript_68399/g.61466  ORF Transcript_68399/g.61466 Transcript_68399/m.61466 type:complete len:167 (+) Transcript_68399:244-744(+)
MSGNIGAQLGIGLCIGVFLIAGHVFGMLAAEWSMDVLDFHPECIWENWYDFVNGDFSEALNGASWAGLVMACLLIAALFVGSRVGTPGMIAFYVILCIYVVTYLAWAVLLMYIMLFFSYIYFEETRLVHTCGGLDEVRNIWWICLAAICQSLPAAIGGCLYACYAS